MLLSPQQVAGAADFHVAHGNIESGTEVGELLDSAQPHSAFLGKPFALGYQQISKRPFVGPAHPAPDLVELTEPQSVRSIDQDGIYRGDVYPRLYDHCTD